MKKLLIGLLIALAVMVLLVVAMNACDQVPTAEAISIFTPTGVVNANLLPSAFVGQFTEVSYSNITFLPSDLAPGNYFYKQYSYSTVTYNGNGSVVFDYCRLYFVFSIPADGYYCFTVMVSASQNYNVYPSRSVLGSGTSVSLGNLYTNSNRVSSYYGNGNYFYSGDVVCLSFTFTGWPGTLSPYQKLERFDTEPVNDNYAFTGFVVPNISYVPEPSSYDSWDGLVHPNYINSPDFYNYPVFVESYNNLADSYKNMWLSNMDGYSYDYNGPDTLSSFTMNVHAYGQNEDDAFLYYYDNYVDSFDFARINAHFRLALNSEVAGTVTLTSGGGSVSERFDVGGSLVDLLLPDTYTTSFIAISIVFDQYAGQQNKICTLFYSKLEWGTFFTGYVVPNHPISSAVQDNVLNNYDFSSVPLPSDSPSQGAWWYLYHEDQGVAGEHDEYISFSSQYGGLTFDATPINSHGTIYFTYAVPESDSFDSSGSYIFTVQLWSSNTLGSPVVFTAKDGVNDVTYRSIFPAAGGPKDYSFRFPKINGVILSLSFPVRHGMPNTLYYAKLESWSFTGFCGNFQEFYDNGYNSGYSDGYTTGSESYGTSLFTLNFDQPADYTVLDFGWSDMGFLDADAMFSSSMTFDFIGFYRALGYAIATQVTVDVPAQSIRRLYASADINFNVSNVSVAQDYVLLELSENSSRLVIVNAQYPNDYTPEVYPEYRVVRVNVQRGLSNILDAYGESKYEQGRLVGYDQGYMQGNADGERRGYSQATEVAMNSTGGWFGFVSAFIDVPIKALTSLLDFDFFGFNLLNIIKILLVFSLVYLVIRLITKGMIAQ